MTTKRYELPRNLPDEIVLKRFKKSRYYVSINGLVYSSQSNKFLSGYKGFRYLWFGLTVDGKDISVAQHRLIAEVFIPNPLNYPIVRHLDDNPYNNSLSNLAWGNKSQNMHDAINNGLLKDRPPPRGEKCRSAKLTEQKVKELRRLFHSGTRVRDLVIKFGVTDGTVYKVALRQTWKHVQ